MIHTLHYRIHEVTDYINWLYFFHAWGFAPRFAAIAKVHGCEACHTNWVDTFPEAEREKAKEAARLYTEARAMLNLLDEQYRTHALVGLFEANGDGDDILVWTEDGTQHRLPLLRQQQGEACLCLSDYVRPIGHGVRDRIGIFASTTDEAIEQSFPHDDFQHMLCQTLADRLAEATIERAHEETRKTLWGYAPDEQLELEDLFRENYQGRRPAVGYPSLPDQSFAFLLRDILGMESIGIRLTESGAMQPHASTCGLMISHPKMRHFSIGAIGKDQLEDYARRRGLSAEILRPYLSPNLQES